MEALTGVDTVVFDADGTLLDSIGPFLELANTTFAQVGLPRVSRAEICAALRKGGSPFPHLIASSRPQRDELLQRCHAIAVGLWPTLKKAIRLIPGSEAALRRLALRGYQLGIATASWGDHLEGLRASPGLGSLFGAVVSGLEVANLKPAPDLLMECLRRMDRQPWQAIYVGDSTLDISAAHAAGCRAVGVLSGVSGRPELEGMVLAAIIESVADLPAILP